MTGFTQDLILRYRCYFIARHFHLVNTITLLLRPHNFVPAKRHTCYNQTHPVDTDKGHILTSHPLKSFIIFPCLYGHSNSLFIFPLLVFYIDSNFNSFKNCMCIPDTYKRTVVEVQLWVRPLNLVWSYPGHFVNTAKFSWHAGDRN